VEEDSVWLELGHLVHQEDLEELIAELVMRVVIHQRKDKMLDQGNGTVELEVEEDQELVEQGDHKLEDLVEQVNLQQLEVQQHHQHQHFMVVEVEDLLM
jgi:hypothetical protein